MSDDFMSQVTAEDYYQVKSVDRRLVESCHLSSGVFCDVGGSGGVDALRLANRGLCGVCIDIGLKALKSGKQRSKLLGLDGKVEFVCASATQLPFAAECFELVTSFSVIDHLPNKQAAANSISEFSRVAKKSGFVVVTVPNKLFLLGTLMMRLQKVIFEQRFTSKELHGDFRNVGLTVFKYDSQYPTKAGSTILKYNLPSVAQRIPQHLLRSAFSVTSRIFQFVELNLPFNLMGGRLGVAAKKIM
jgi:ubiquinone/menaquinone biosynthesis C-methylase UbiE